MLLLLLIATAVQAQIQHFQWQGGQREYLVKIPAQHDETMPVLYFLHGLGDNITRLDNEFHFQQVADEFGWMLVVPQALPQSGYTMWNAALMSSSIDDSGFLMALLDTLAVMRSPCSMAMRWVMKPPIEKPVKNTLSGLTGYCTARLSRSAIRNPESSMLLLINAAFHMV